jgi:hypothetical protein
VFFIVDEDAREGEREKVGPQEAAAVHGVAPGLADASNGGEPARRDAAEDLSASMSSGRRASDRPRLRMAV